LLTVLVISGLAADTLTVKLKNGTVYSGTLSFENSSVCIITQDDRSYTIQKANIKTVNGKEFSENIELQAYTSPPAPVPAQPITPSTDTAAVDYRGKKITIILKNGMVFNGTVISDKGRMLLIDRDGAPVNLYKSTIARIEIDGETGKTGEPAGNAKSNENVTPNEIINKPAFSVSSLEDESGPVDHSTAENSLQVTKPQPPAPAEITSGRTETVPVVSVTRADTTDVVKNARNVVSINTTDTFPGSRKQVSVPVEPKTQPAAVFQTSHIPQNVYFPSVTRSGDSKKTIVLKNGTVFMGYVQSEDERFIIIDSDGTSLNILKKMIKTVDGQGYLSTAPVKAPAVFQGPEKAELAIQKGTISRKRPRLTVSVPSEITTTMLLDSLKSPVWERRSRACRMLGAMGDWAFSAVPVISKMFADTAQSRMIVPVWIDSSDIGRLLAPSLEAARALAYLGANGYQALINGLSSPDCLARRSAVFGLLEFTGEKPKTEVLFKMLKDRDASVRAVALGAFCTESGEQLLIDALRDSETAIRCNAALLLGKMRSERALRELENLLTDNRSLVRAHAVEAIGEIGAIHSSTKITVLLDDPNFAVREKAAEALGYLGDTIAIVPLINALRDVNPDVRGTAATALSYIRDPRAIPSLYSLLKDENSTVREKARNSLRLHTELKQLIDGLNDQRTTVRENASYVLWLLTGKDFGNDPEKWKQWYADQGKKKVPLK
jgi:HEAT repeat protein/sRNA-binding regulator protein Hfq